MANPIYCDWEGCEELASVLVSRLADGETIAWCDPHWGAFVLATAQAAEPGQELPGPEPQPPAPDEGQPDRDDEDADDAEALRRLEGTSAPRTADSGPVEESAAQGPSEPPGPAGEAVEGPTVVRRGTSRSRRQHEARKRQRAAEQAAEQAPTE